MFFSRGLFLDIIYLWAKHRTEAKDLYNSSHYSRMPYSLENSLRLIVAFLCILILLNIEQISRSLENFERAHYRNKIFYSHILSSDVIKDRTTSFGFAVYVEELHAL